MSDTFDIEASRKLAADAAARAEKASMGPWSVVSGKEPKGFPVAWFNGTDGNDDLYYGVIPYEMSAMASDDARFIAAARQDVPALAAALAAACDEVERLHTDIAGAQLGRTLAVVEVEKLREAAKHSWFALCDVKAFTGGNILIDTALAALRQARGEERS